MSNGERSTSDQAILLWHFFQSLFKLRCQSKINLFLRGTPQILKRENKSTWVYFLHLIEVLKLFFNHFIIQNLLWMAFTNQYIFMPFSVDSSSSTLKQSRQIDRHTPMLPMSYFMFQTDPNMSSHDDYPPSKNSKFILGSAAHPTYTTKRYT